MGEGRVRRAFLGIAGGSRPLPPRVALSTGRTSGIEVLRVVAGSPAAGAGLQLEDILLEVDGIPVGDVGELQRLMTAERVGRRLPLQLARGAEVRRVEVVLHGLTE